jgi:hypothetical protein
MPSYRRIEKAGDIRADDTESETLDFKEYVEPEHWWEVAKDVAAFANHLGGVLLVGAKELPDGTATYDGLPDEKARKISEAYENYARQKCVPRQTVRPILLPRANYNWVVSVNVEPSPVFVSSEYPTIAERKADSTKTKATVWRFPLRCGRHTDYLSPELLPMFLDPKTRRSSVLLNELEGKELWVMTQHDHLRSKVKGVDLKRNQVHLEVFPPTSPSFEAHLPFEDVEAVWQGRNQWWFARLSGYFESTGYQALRLIPRGPIFPE